MITVKPLEMTDVGIHENFLVEYEQRGIKGVITWWAKLRTESQGKDLVINTAEPYNRIILNGNEITPN